MTLRELLEGLYYLDDHEMSVREVCKMLSHDRSMEWDEELVLETSMWYDLELAYARQKRLPY